MGAEQGIEESPKIKNNIHTFRPLYISLPFAAPSPSEIFSGSRSPDRLPFSKDQV